MNPAQIPPPPENGFVMDYQAKIARNVASIPRSGIRDFFELVQGRDDVISPL